MSTRLSVLRRRVREHGVVAREGVPRRPRVRAGGRRRPCPGPAARVGGRPRRRRGVRRLRARTGRHAPGLRGRSAPIPTRMPPSRCGRSPPAATCSSRSRWPRPWRRPSRWWPRRRGPGASSWSATSSGTIPSWLKFIELARTLGTPLVMRMNLNQQSAGRAVGHAPEPPEVDVADCRLRRALRRRHVPDDAVAPRAGQRDRREARRRHRGGDVQLRPAPGRVRRRVGRLVRGRAGGR